MNVDEYLICLNMGTYITVFLLKGDIVKASKGSTFFHEVQVIVLYIMIPYYIFS